jgi:hypothetical protein
MGSERGAKPKPAKIQQGEAIAKSEGYLVRRVYKIKAVRLFFNRAFHCVSSMSIEVRYLLNKTIAFNSDTFLAESSMPCN